MRIIQDREAVVQQKFRVRAGAVGIEQFETLDVLAVLGGEELKTIIDQPVGALNGVGMVQAVGERHQRRLPQFMTQRQR